VPKKSSEPLKKLMSGALQFRHFVLGAIAIFIYVGVEVGTPGLFDSLVVRYACRKKQPQVLLPEPIGFLC